MRLTGEAQKWVGGEAGGGGQLWYSTTCSFTFLPFAFLPVHVPSVPNFTTMLVVANDTFFLSPFAFVLESTPEASGGRSSPSGGSPAWGTNPPKREEDH